MFTKMISRLILTLALGGLAFFVIPKPALADVTSGIIKPINGSTVSGPLVIRGIADDPHFKAWQLDLLPHGDIHSAIFLRRGTTRSQTPEQFARIDSTLFENGSHQLRLRVIRTDGNYSEYFTSVTIANDPFISNGIAGVISDVKYGCLTSIQGIAHSENFFKYQMDLLLDGDENKPIMLQRGSQQHFSLGNLVYFNTTHVPDGKHMLRLRVVRLDGNYETHYAPIIIDNSIMKDAVSHNGCNCEAAAPDAEPTRNQLITYPLNATTLKGTIPVCGIADDPILLGWQLELLFNGDDKQAVIVARGDNPTLERNPFTLLDTTALPDGRYGLRLTVARTDDTLSRNTIYVCIQNNALTAASPTGTCKP